MRLFRKCCKCFRSKNPENSVIISPDPVPAANPEPNQHPTSIVQVDTKFRLNDIKQSDFTPSSTQKNNYSYNCPICLRYFSTILVLKCCKQYICHYCIDELSKNVKFEVACPHCKATPILASDVDFNSTIKKYSDSPIGTFKLSNNPEPNKWVQLNVVKEDSEFEESAKLPVNLNLSLTYESAAVNLVMHMTA